MEFSEAQINRYARHILLQEVGGEGQAKLLGSRVLVIGAGGLGSPVLLYLAAAGVGTIGIVDDDVVDLSNLQRQIVHATANTGMSKVESACSTLAAVNPDIELISHHTRIAAENALELIS
ncbi:MAG: HesA/MoeB/ThiF family protein, partial [Rhodospirillales bacterium]